MKFWGVSSILFLILLVLKEIRAGKEENGWVTTQGVQFMLNGSSFYSNGFNAYWLMVVAYDVKERSKVTEVFKQAQMYNLTIVRTWAFNDNPGNFSLQSSPGVYDQTMFQGLDYVISEAGKYGIKLILSLVNNYDDYGGKKQYVRWVYPDRNLSAVSNASDEFFTDENVKQLYKNHVQAVLTRNNTISGVVYKDDPTIMAWELMNEPRCPSDVSGNTLKKWIAEMAGYLKSIDANHLLEVGLEGFYNPSNGYKNQGLPYYQVGTDFISNNQIPEIDFTTAHLYPIAWLRNGSSDEEQVEFLKKWIKVHIDDAQNTTLLHKPMLLAEFGKHEQDPGYSVTKRDNFMRTAYTAMYSSAKAGGAAAGSLFWQIMVEGLPNYKDGLSIILSQNTSTNDLIYQESQRLAELSKMYAMLKNKEEWKKMKKNTKGATAREIHGNGNGN